jgi:hypothetical protein
MSPPLTAPAACYSNDFNTRKNCRQACTLETCPMSLSYWAYLPSLAANGTFTALFSLSLALYVVQAVYSRRFIGFSVAMLCGSVLEVIGYVGRLMSYRDPFSEVRRFNIANAESYVQPTAFATQCKSPSDLTTERLPPRNHMLDHRPCLLCSRSILLPFTDRGDIRSR